MRNEKTTEQVAHAIRARVFQHTIRNNGGYLSQACSAAEQLALLYNEVLNLGPSTLPWCLRPFPACPRQAIPATSPVRATMAPPMRCMTGCSSRPRITHWSPMPA